MRQRSKRELLGILKTHEAIRKDKEQGTELFRKFGYWRIGVEWCCTLWKEEKWSTGQLAQLLQYIADNDPESLTQERKEEIRALLDKRVDWTFRNTVSKDIRRNAADQSFNELVFYNTEAAVNYSLLVCEYLITRKGFGRKRLNRNVGSVRYADDQDIQLVQYMRRDLYEEKGIWIELDEEDTPENMKDLSEITRISKAAST